MECSVSAVRGSTVLLKATCYDAAGVLVTPNSATMRLAYTSGNGGGLTKVGPIQMAITGSVVSAEWDSSVAMAGPVYWSIRAVASNTIAAEGVFALLSNPANA